MPTAQLTHQPREKKPFVAGLLGVCAVFAAFALLAREAPESPGRELSTPTHPLMPPEPVCRLSGAAAAQRARSLESLADASWERVPFAPQEAPRAVLFAAEAGSCFAAALDRDSRQRAQGKRERYQAELDQRWTRALIGLELGRKRDQLERMSEALGTLLALSSQAGADGSAYRGWLERERRQVQDRLDEREQKEEGP